MTRNFKIIIIIFFTYFLVNKKSFGQDASKFNNTWTTLKTQLLRRTDLVSQLVNFLQQNKNADTTVPCKLKGIAGSLANILNTSCQLDSIAVANIHDTNDSISLFIDKLYNILVNDKRFIQSDAFIYYATELEGTENRIHIAVKNFKEECISTGRHDLYFRTLWGNSR